MSKRRWLAIWFVVVVVLVGAAASTAAVLGQEDRGNAWGAVACGCTLLTGMALMLFFRACERCRDEAEQ